MFRVNIPYHTWRLNIWNGLNLDVLPYKPIFHGCRSESQRLSYLKSIEARACRWLGLYVCASQVCVCLCAVGGPFGSFRKQIWGLGETGSEQCFLYSMSMRCWLAGTRYIMFFPIRAAQCNGRFYNNHTACVCFPQCEWGSGFSILPAVPALSSSIPPFIPSTATPGTSSAGN